MNTQVFRIAATLATLASGAALAQDYPTAQRYDNDYGNDRRQAQIVRCESTDSRSVFCRFDARGQVRLVRQLSRTQCVEGRNWSAGASGIRVTGGCRADFQVFADGRNGNGDYPYRDRDRDGGRDDVFDDRRYRGRVGQAMQCVSSNRGRTWCGDGRSNYRLVGYRNPNCMEGRNWGRTSQGALWVSGNCNLTVARVADEERRYRIDDGRDGYYQEERGYRGSETVQLINCQSTVYGGRTYCGDRNRTYVLSGARDSDCLSGQTYGRDENGTWVSGSCDAQFALQPIGDYQR